MAEAYCDKVKPYFEVIRDHCDKLEFWQWAMDFN
jgi:glutamine synthetase